MQKRGGTRARVRVTRAPDEALRVGCVKYLNARPLIFGWQGAVAFDHPAALCRKLAAGELDVAFVSSFEFLCNPIYSIVDDVALGSDGPVSSVVLIHSGAFSEIEEIVLDSTSLSSVNLLRCLLAESSISARLVASATDDDVLITRTRARLLIGDQAIRFREQHGTQYRYRDLGEWWKEITGLPFIFALWLIRPEVENAKAIADRLRATRDANLASLDKVIAAETEFGPAFCAHYFRDCLRFRFAEREKEGLLEFRVLCERHEILPPIAAPLRLV